MAKAEIKIDVTEAIAKIKILNAETEKFKAAMIEVKNTAEDTEKAMRDFVNACSNINCG